MENFAIELLYQGTPRNSTVDNFACFGLILLLQPHDGTGLPKPAEYSVVRVSCHHLHGPVTSRVMDTSTVILGIGQLVLTVAVAYIAWLVRRDARRSSLVSLVTVLNELRERNNRALAASLSSLSSGDFKQGDEQLRAGVVDSINRLRAIQDAITEAQLHTLHQCDNEWGFAGRLHSALRSQLNFSADSDRENRLAHHGLL